MKKRFLSTLAWVALATLPVFGQSVVRVTQLSSADGAAPSLTFHVGWATAPTPPDHRDTVWLFADVRTVNPDGSTGAWTAATITGATTTAGTLSYPIALPYRGFYLAGNPAGAFDAAMTVTLAAPTNTKFNVCVYASDYPPNATLQSNGNGYALRGTPPFIINNSIRESSYTFDDAGVCITSITDSTGCPGFVVNPPIVPGSIPSTGDTVCAGGTPATIVGLMPFGGGDGQLAYSWYKDNVLIDGATGADYTPPSTLAPGTYIYTRKVNDRTCGVAPLASEGSWALTVEEAPATTLTASSPTVCEGAAVTLTATAGAALYSFNGGAWLANNTSPVTVTATTTYTVKARSTLGCESAEATTTVTANAVPAITLASGSTAQTITAGSAISQIKYTTANATGATATGLPEGVIGAWASNTYTISGTPASIGTYSYTVTATTANGCPNDSVRGTITVNITCEPSTITLGTVGFTSTDTYTWNGLMVSSPVTVTYCNNRSHTLFNGGSSVTMYYADCAVNAFGGGRGNWFSWCMVKQYADMLCPSPWRVPTPEDWCTLISSWYACPGGDGTNLTRQKGWTYQGIIKPPNTAERANSDTWHWTADDNNGALLHTAYAHMDSNNWICMYVENGNPKNRGYSLRCVQDAP